VHEAIDKLEEGLATLEETIEKPETGLIAQDASLEQAMRDNVANQKQLTSMRKEENIQYQKNVEQLTKTEVLLAKAIKVLKKFYSSLHEKSGVAEASFVQKGGPKAPQTWDGAYGGQSKASGDVIGMLNYILEGTKEQVTHAHEDENEAQESFEDNMADLTKEQKEQEKNLVKVKTARAKAEQGMVDSKQDLKQARKDEKATLSLLADIKPGCDFIFDNFYRRTQNRKTETQALVQAKELLKGSPAYQAATAEAEAESLGACKSKCEVPEHAKCKACLSDVSVPGYCAGHKGTPGCDRLD